MAGDKGGDAKEGMDVNLIKTYMRMKFSNIIFFEEKTSGHISKCFRVLRIQTFVN